MQTELRRAQNREILANARLHQTSHCPNCGKRQWYVIETTPLVGRDIRRRRRRCDHCGHRDTTYEIPAFMYRQMQKDRKVSERIIRMEQQDSKAACRAMPEEIVRAYELRCLPRVGCAWTFHVMRQARTLLWLFQNLYCQIH